MRSVDFDRRNATKDAASEKEQKRKLQRQLKQETKVRISVAPNHFRVQSIVRKLACFLFFLLLVNVHEQLID
jgi:hypothetical protein